MFFHCQSKFFRKFTRKSGLRFSNNYNPDFRENSFDDKKQRRYFKKNMYYCI